MGWFFILLDLSMALGFSLMVLSRKRRIPSVTLAWIFSFFFLPVLGFLLYALFGFRNLRLRRRRRPKSLRQESFAPSVSVEFGDRETFQLAVLGEKLTGLPPVGSNDVRLYEQASEACAAMIEAIHSAKHHVHLEFYIFQPDETGALVRDALVESARRGVECRVLLDAVGSFHLTQRYLAPMREAGVFVHFFGSGGLTRPWGFQLRNHRKLLIVDGLVGFTGSQNIGNEYNRGSVGKLSWRDTLVRLRGPAVHQLQKIFAEDWEFTAREDLHREAYFPPASVSGDCVVQTLPTGPDEKADSLEMILIHMIHQASSRVTVVTPYFVPSVPVVLALGSAAQRGVRVDLLVPRRSDSWIVDRAARSWFSDLLDDGVHIYEYGRTFVHAKVVTIDDRICLLGSANMDERSFKINFECSLIVYDSKVTGLLVENFDSMQVASRPILPTRSRREGFFKRAGDGVFKMLSPLL